MIKVYGGNLHGIEQRRFIIATSSKKKVAEAIRESMRYVQDFVCQTGDQFEVEMAKQYEGKLVVFKDCWGQDRRKHAIVADDVQEFMDKERKHWITK